MTQASNRKTILGKMFLTAVAVLGFATALPAQSSKEIKQHEDAKAKLEKEIEILDRQLAENADKSKDALSQLTLIQGKISSRKKLLAASDRQINAWSEEIKSTQRQINKLQAREDTLTEHYSRLVRSAYRNRDAKIWYMYILASENLSQAFRRFGYFKNLSEQMKEQATQIREVRADLEKEKARLQNLRSEETKLRERRQADVNALKKEETQSSNVVSQLKRNRTKYQKELNSKKRQVENLNREIKRLVQEAMKQGSGKGAAQEIDYKLAGEFSANKGKLPWPATGPVVDYFGQHNHPVYTSLKLPFNNGITIALAKGTKVKSVFNGVVKQIVVMPGYNQCVLVQHGNYFSFYCKLKTTSVKPGDKVSTGEVLGEVDTINGETQLHFQIWKDQAPQDPEQWLR